MSTLATGPGSLERTDMGWRRNARRLRKTAWIAVLFAALVFAAWRILLAPVAVLTHTVGSGAVTAEVLGTGTLEARTSALLGPKMAGLIVRITADQGDRVKAGDTLIHLEDTDVREQVALAEADRAVALAAIDRLRADMGRAEAVLAQARRNHQRFTETTAADVTSQQELDKAVEALAIAEAEWSRAGTAIIEGQKSQAAAERALDFQRARLEDTTIEAPFDGLVVRRDREPGDVVTAGSSVLLLVSLAEMWVTAWVDETELARLAEGQQARVVFRSEPDTEYPGAVARVGREVDRETREVVVDVRVERLPGVWAVGQRAEVYIRTHHKENVPLLPAGLLIVREGATGVMVHDGGEARWHEVDVGLRGREVVEVTGGLSPGDRVVRPSEPSAAPLRDGRRVRAETD